MSILTVDLDLTAVKCNVIVLCNTHTREMLLSLPAAAATAAHCSSVLLLCCCSAAQVQLVWLCNHWVRLHCCTLPVLLLKVGLAWLGLAWVEEFKLSLSLELVWLGLGTLAWVPWMKISWIFHKLSQLSSFTNCSYISPLIEEILEKSSRNENYQNYHWSIWRSFGNCDKIFWSLSFKVFPCKSSQQSSNYCGNP